jgi:uncharacterized protein (TIGR02118 family)
MINVSVIYPNSENAKFDQAYYAEKHMPLVKARLGAALKRAEINRPIASGQPGQPAAWVGGCNLYFDSVEAFQAAFAPHGAELLGDIPNFSNVQPYIVVSESSPL